MVIAVMGMHRSGTSMVTGMLAGCGLQVGPTEELLGPSPENPTGYWERRSMVLLDDTVLDALGLAWDHIPNPPTGAWLEQPAIGGLLEQARRIVASFPQAGSWGWKDPRSSFTLPFWEAAIGEATTVVVCVRNPLDVAASLARRGAMSQRLACHLWHAYCAAALELATARRAIVTHYDSYFHDSAAELRRVCDAVALTPSDHTLAEAAGSAERAHRHSSHGLADLVRSSVPDATVALYLELLGASGPTMSDVAQRDALVLEPEDGPFDRDAATEWVAEFRRVHGETFG